MIIYHTIAIAYSENVLSNAFYCCIHSIITIFTNRQFISHRSHRVVALSESDGKNKMMQMSKMIVVVMHQMSLVKNKQLLLSVFRIQSMFLFFLFPSFLRFYYKELPLWVGFYSFIRTYRNIYIYRKKEKNQFYERIQFHRTQFFELNKNRP